MVDWADIAADSSLSALEKEANRKQKIIEKKRYPVTLARTTQKIRIIYQKVLDIFVKA